MSDEEVNIRLTVREAAMFSRTCKLMSDQLQRVPGHETCGIPLLDLAIKILTQVNKQVKPDESRQATAKP